MLAQLSGPWESGGLEEHLLVMPIDYRCYVTQEFLGFFYNVDKSTICRAIQRIERLVHPLFGVRREPKLSRREVEALIVDCTEQPIRGGRPIRAKTYAKATPKNYRFISVASAISCNSIPDGKCRP
jgi:hypothetical protein